MATDESRMKEISDLLGKVERDLDTATGYLEGALYSMREVRAKKSTDKMLEDIKNGRPVEDVLAELRMPKSINAVETQELVNVAQQFLDGAITVYEFVNKVADIGQTVTPERYDYEPSDEQLTAEIMGIVRRGGKPAVAKLIEVLKEFGIDIKM